MEDEKKKMQPMSIVLLIIFFVVLAVIIVLAIWTISIIFNSKNDNNINENSDNIQVDNNNNINNNNDDSDDVGGINKTNNKVIVVNGLKFTIDSNEFFSAVYIAGESFSLLKTGNKMDESLDILFSVSNNSYENEIQHPNNLMKNAVSRGAEITKNIQEVTINNRKCAYFTYNEEGKHYLEAYTSGNDEKKISIEVQISDEKISEALEIFVKIANLAVSTNEPDTTDKLILGVKKESSELKVNDKTIAFKVPKNFYSGDIFSTESSAIESFLNKDTDISASVKLEYLSSEEGVESEEDYLNTMSSTVAYHEDFSSSGVKNMDVAGKQIKYIVYEYTLYDMHIKNLYAVYNAGNNLRIIINAGTSDSEKYELNIDMIKDFCEITIK